MLRWQSLTMRSNHIKAKDAILPGLLAIENKDKREPAGSDLLDLRITSHVIDEFPAACDLKIKS